MGKRGPAGPPKEVIEQAAKMYAEGLGLDVISRAIGRGRTTLRKHLLRAGVKIRNCHDGSRLAFARRGSSPLKGTKRGPLPKWHVEKVSAGQKTRWEGKSSGVSQKPRGYVVYTTGPNKGLTVHKVAMEEFMGRPLAKGEIVHHINGIRSDNRIENLALMSAGDHQRLHRTMDWALRLWERRGWTPSQSPISLLIVNPKDQRWLKTK